MGIKQKTYNLLRWSQKYTKTDMVYLAKGGFWLTLKQGVHLATSFLVAMAFANFLPQEAYGQYKYILSTVGLISIVTLNGFSTALLRSTARGYEGSINKIVTTKIKWGVIGGIASLIISTYYFFNGNHKLFIGFLIVSFFIPLFQSFEIFIPFLTGRKLFSAVAKYEIIMQTTLTTSLIVSVFFTNNILIILLIYYLSYTLPRFLLLKWVIKKFHPNNKEEKDTVSLGKHFSLMGVADSVASKIDSVLMWHFLGAIPLAIYSFASIPTKQLKSSVQSSGLLALIKISEKGVGTVKKTLPMKALKFLIILIPIVITYIILAPYIYKLMFPQYLESIKYTQFLSLNLLFYPKAFFDAALTVSGHKKKLYFMRVSGPILNIMLLIALLPFYGIWGAVAASLGTQVYKTIAMIWLFRKL